MRWSGAQWNTSFNLYGIGTEAIYHSSSNRTCTEWKLEMKRLEGSWDAGGDLLVGEEEEDLPSSPNASIYLSPHKTFHLAVIAGAEDLLLLCKRPP